MNYIILGIGVYMVVITFFMETHNNKSIFLLKAIPVLCGLILIIYAIKMLGWI
jgi:hypothetical protein